MLYRRFSRGIPRHLTFILTCRGFASSDLGRRISCTPFLYSALTLFSSTEVGSGMLR